jgi:phosphatidylserine/phosphatidylglycerophosphate/cardiolipin synthase-like enzyme
MRATATKQGVKVNAIAGSFVVFFGLDISEKRRKGFRGFAFKRLDHARGETIWLRGMKTFEETEPHPTPGEQFPTIDHPIQSFQWADYSVKPGLKYTYTIVTRYGNATKLTTSTELEVKVNTERERGELHSVFFNRGSVATQEYARRFQNLRPSEAGPGAYEWLSRGLLEALIQFITQAEKGWSIHAAVYEFQWPSILEALAAARKRGAVVQVIYDHIEKYRKNANGKKEPAGPWKKNDEAIADAKIKAWCIPRRNSTRIMHNKFFILSQKGKPKAVWTGSTNLTENGIFGHSNLGHIVEDESVADTFMEYWNRLKGDPRVDATYRAANTKATTVPPNPWKAGTNAIFSPRGSAKNLDCLVWYGQIAENTKDALFMTFAFGMHKTFKEIYRKKDEVLRMALLETTRSSPKTAEQDRKDIQAIRNLPNVVMAIGNRIPVNSFDKWLQEIDRLSPHVHVLWVHTKYMLVDPLSDMPVVISGSANFSKASTCDNDENMLVIRGNKRIADIYLGEYLRLYTHYAFREAVKRYTERTGTTKPMQWRPQYLVDDDSWTKPFFDSKDKSGRMARREYFAGPMAL